MYCEVLCPTSRWNCTKIHIFFSSSQTSPFYLSVCVQHFAILLKYIIHVAIPDIPMWVREEMAKLDYQRREAFKVSDKKVIRPKVFLSILEKVARDREVYVQELIIGKLGSLIKP